MNRMILGVVAAVCVVAAVPVIARPFTARDLAMLDRVSAPRLSPDGRYVAHALRSTDWDGNGSTNGLHVIDLRSANSQPLVVVSGEKGGPSPRWSADGRWLYFLSSKSGSAQVWRASPDGQLRRQLTAFPVDVTGFRLMGGDKGLVVSADVYQDCPTLACTKARAEEKAKAKPTGVRVKAGAARFWDTYEDGRYVGLFTVPLDQEGAPGEARNLLDAFPVDVPADDGIAVSPDGSIIYFASRDPEAKPGEHMLTWIYAVPTDGSAVPRRVVGDPATSVLRPSLSPDGRRLAFLSTRRVTGTYDHLAPMVLDLKSGRIRDVTPGLDANLTRLSWSSDGRSLLATSDDRGQAPILEIDPAKGTVSRLTGDGIISEFDDAAGRIAYVRETLNSPQQIFVQSGTGPSQQVTRVGASVLSAARLGEAEQFDFTGWNGEKVYGYVVKPHGFVPGQKYPVAFLIHGGPHSSLGNAWSYRWNPQVWSGMGYAVVSVDFHGSSGYGEEFGRSIVGHWGDRPLEDLQKGWAHALSRYAFLDGNRACALGGSYGGYMVAWIASQWQQPWKCLVNHAGLFDVRSAGWSMDGLAFIDAQMGGTKRLEDVERFNPALRAGNWKVPMLVIHGGRDFRVPLDQGVAAHNAARRSGVPTEFLLFPDENHWILKPQNSVQWYQVVEEWMNRWTASAPSPAN